MKHFRRCQNTFQPAKIIWCHCLYYDLLWWLEIIPDIQWTRSEGDQQNLERTSLSTTFWFRYVFIRREALTHMVNLTLNSRKWNFCGFLTSKFGLHHCMALILKTLRYGPYWRAISYVSCTQVKEALKLSW